MVDVSDLFSHFEYFDCGGFPTGFSNNNHPTVTYTVVV